MEGFSFTTMVTPELDGVEAIKLARRFGYQGVDLRVSEQQGELRMDSSPREIALLKEAFASEGVQPSGLLCYNDTGKDTEASWDRMRDSLLRCLELAEELGSPTIRIFTGNGKNYGDPEAYWMKNAETLSEVLDMDSSEIGILLQHHSQRMGCKEVLKILQQVGSPRCGMIFSPEHCMIAGEKLQEVYNPAALWTRQLYIADVALVDGAYRDILPGKGEVPFSAVYKVLGGNAFSGWITFKWERIWRKELEPVEIALPWFMNYARVFSEAAEQQCI